MTGTCNYYFTGDKPEGRTWWMQISWTNGTYAYVWIQYLNFGHNHRCRVIKTLEMYTIGGEDNWCPLVRFNT